MGMKYRDPNTGQLKELSLEPLYAITAPIGNVSAAFNDNSFNCPDYRDRVPVGLDSNDSNFDTLGKTGGEKTHTLTIDELPNHNHGITYNTGGAGANTGGTFALGNSVSTSKAYTQTTGNNKSHNNLQPYIVTNYIIKAEKSVGVLGKILNIFSNSNKDSYSCKYINDTYGGGVKNYSTNEIKLNEKWIDGKPIYRKVILSTKTLVSGNNDIDTNITNLDELINLRYVFTYSNGQQFYSYFNGITNTILLKNTKLRIVSNAPLALEKIYYIIEYTKTTD